ncbi:uncharacterized protein B0H18DRAFT_1101879 [Fomitopsis serialis]|uniref:uncharacterized protein n=1 Tax=Fomitopsis serialis TaxID=139415 RepID=UPI002008E7E4|nr:uncharacterized protein B0H18DRAFT_1101879 [Neoantrodia serialis]KAH9933739.1 hypothetical protein B0H18DRAFT_1101879 [Neoantrodia serialis]
MTDSIDMQAAREIINMLEERLYDNQYEDPLSLVDEPRMVDPIFEDPRKMPISFLEPENCVLIDGLLGFAVTESPLDAARRLVQGLPIMEEVSTTLDTVELPSTEVGPRQQPHTLARPGQSRRRLSLPVRVTDTLHSFLLGIHYPGRARAYGAEAKTFVVGRLSLPSKAMSSVADDSSAEVGSVLSPPTQKTSSNGRRGGPGKYLCDLPGCSKSFASAQNLSRHKNRTKQHGAKVLYKCPVCEWTTTRCDPFRRHFDGDTHVACKEFVLKKSGESDVKDIPLQFIAQYKISTEST